MTSEQMICRAHGESVLGLLTALAGVPDEALAWERPVAGGDGASLLLTMTHQWD